MKTNTIPENGIYTTHNKKVLKHGDSFPTTPNKKDRYEEGDYIYKYNYIPDDLNADGPCSKDMFLNGWSVFVKDKMKTEYEPIKTEIAGKPVVSLYKTFDGCIKLKHSPEIPPTIKNMDYTFAACYLMTESPIIPYGVKSMRCTYHDCRKLTKTVDIPDSVESMAGTYSMCCELVSINKLSNNASDISNLCAGCYNLKTISELPNKTMDMTFAFLGCKSLAKAPEIPDGTKCMWETFCRCDSLIATPDIADSVDNMDSTFRDCKNLKVINKLPKGCKKYRNTFFGCRGLVDLSQTEIPVGTEILDGTFEYCTSLKYPPSLPYGLRIMDSTFAEDYELRKAPTIPETVKWQDDVFWNCHKLPIAALQNKRKENKKMSIKLSPKHGLNPTIPICFFCGKDKNEIVLAGKINKNDDEMPMHTIIDYEPCNECKAKMDKGITLIEATTKPANPNQPPIQNGIYPTGKWCVVTENFIKNNINSEEMVNWTLKVRKAFMEPEIMEMLTNASEKQ